VKLWTAFICVADVTVWQQPMYLGSGVMLHRNQQTLISLSFWLSACLSIGINTIYRSISKTQLDLCLVKIFYFHVIVIVRA